MNSHTPPNVCLDYGYDGFCDPNPEANKADHPPTRGKSSRKEASAPETQPPSAQQDTGTDEYRIELHKKARELATLFQAQDRTDAFHAQSIDELTRHQSTASWAEITKQRAVAAKALFDAEIDLAGEEMAAVVDRQRARNQEFDDLYESKFGENATPWWLLGFSGELLPTVEALLEKGGSEGSIVRHPEVQRDVFRRTFDALPLEMRVSLAGQLNRRPDLADDLLGHRSSRIVTAARRSLYFANHNAARASGKPIEGWRDLAAYGDPAYRMQIAQTTDDSEMLKRLSEPDEEAAIRKAARR